MTTSSPTVPTSSDDLELRLASIREIAKLIHAGEDMDSLLDQVNHGICRHSAWAFSAIVAIDEVQCRTVLVSEYSAFGELDRTAERTWALEASPALRALDRGEAILIPDAQNQSEFPTYRQQARQLGFRSVVIRPIGAHDDKRRPLLLSLKAREAIALGPQELSFIATVAELTALAVERVRRMRREQEGSRRLRAAVATLTGVIEQTLYAPSRSGLATKLGQLLPWPWLVVDFLHATLEASRAPPAGLAPADWPPPLGHGEDSVLAQLRHACHPQTAALHIDLDLAGGRFGALVRPVVVDGESLGALCLLPQGAVLDDMDQLAAQAAQFALGVLLMRDAVRFRSVSHSRRDVIRRILEGSWSEREEILSHALATGLDLSHANHLILVAPAIAGAAERHSHRQAALERGAQLVFGSAAAVSQHEAAFLVLVPGDAAMGRAARERFLNEVRWAVGGEAMLTVSPGAMTLEELAQGYRQAERVLRLAKSLSLQGWVDPSQMGSALVLLSVADHQLVAGFLDQGLMPVITHDRKRNTDYFNTIRVFVEEEGRFQASADRLGLHPTTLRYRLGRLEALFGLDLSQTSTRFDMQLAIRLHELRQDSKSQRPKRG